MDKQLINNIYEVLKSQLSELDLGIKIIKEYNDSLRSMSKLSEFDARYGWDKVDKTYKLVPGKYIKMNKNEIGHPIISFGPVLVFAISTNGKSYTVSAKNPPYIKQDNKIIAIPDIDDIDLQVESFLTIIATEMEEKALIASTACYEYCAEHNIIPKTEKLAGLAHLYKKTAEMFDKCGFNEQSEKYSRCSNKQYICDYNYSLDTQSLLTSNDINVLHNSVGTFELQIAPDNGKVCDIFAIKHGMGAVFEETLVFPLLNEHIELIPFMVDQSNYEKYHNQWQHKDFEKCSDGVTAVISLCNADNLEKRIYGVNDWYKTYEYTKEKIRYAKDQVRKIFVGSLCDESDKLQKQNEIVFSDNIYNNNPVLLRLLGKDGRIFCGLGRQAFVQEITVKSFEYPDNIYITRLFIQIKKPDITFINAELKYNNIYYPTPYIEGLEQNNNMFIEGLEFEEGNVFDTKEVKETAVKTQVQMSLGDLDKLIGLEDVKAQAEMFVAGIQADIARKKQNHATEPPTLHMCFLGNPGTGKTTVARILGHTLHDMKVLKKSEVVECSRSSLVAGYAGQTSQKVADAFERARGGILFIDEAYSLISEGNDSDPYGHEAINELVKLMEDHRHDTMVILAGYKKEMGRFLDSNSGLRSRIPQDHYITFRDYTQDEMCMIFDRIMIDKGFTFKNETTRKEAHKIVKASSRTADFGNARGVRNVFEALKSYIDKRYYKNKDNRTISVLMEEDIENYRKDHEIKKARSWTEDLNEMIGITRAKKQLTEFINLAKVNKIKEKRGLKFNSMALHMIFTGNPGTGKTETARITAKALCESGLTKKDLFVEAKRSDLVGEYAGQTAIKTKSCIEKALGGVLFIDEAYALHEKEGDSYGTEAISTLLAEIENNRDDLVVILAGYDMEINKFLDANPGLRSRFPTIIKFDDFTANELTEIAKIHLQKNGFECTDDAMRAIQNVLTDKMKDKGFGNARGVRNIVEQIIRNQNNRICLLLDENANISDQVLQTIEAEDMKMER